MSDKELKCQLSGIIKTCSESLIFLKMVKIGRKNIRGHYLPNILATQNVPFNKGLSSESEYLLRKNFHQRLDNIKNSQNNLKSDFLKTKSQKIWNYFKKEKKQLVTTKGTIPTTASKGKDTQRTSISSKIKEIDCITTENINLKVSTKVTLKVNTASINQIHYPLLIKNVQNFRGQNLKQYLAERENIISNQFIHNFIEKSLKLVLINTPKLNLKFLFPFIS